MQWLWIQFTLVCLLAPLVADGYELPLNGYVRISDGRELFVNYRPPRPGFPTLVILNGLTYETSDWAAFASALNPHFGLLTYDMAGQGRTLDRQINPGENIDASLQVSELAQLLRKLGITSKIDLLGLSYGGGIAVAFAAAHADKIDRLILMAPYTRPVPSQDLWIRSQMLTARLLNPFMRISDDALYDFFLMQLVYGTYPTAEPAILRHRGQLEAAYHLVKGIRHLNVHELHPNLPENSLHLIVAAHDEYISQSEFNLLWDDVPDQVKASRMDMEETKHKIPQSQPEFAAKWVNLILNDDERLQCGAHFTGIPSQHVVRQKPNSIIIE